MGKHTKRRFGRIGRQGWTYTDDVRKAVRFFITRVARQGAVDLDSDLIPVLEHTYGYRIVRSFLLNCLTVPNKGFVLQFDGDSVSVDVIRASKRKSKDMVVPAAAIGLGETAEQPALVH